MSSQLPYSPTSSQPTSSSEHSETSDSHSSLHSDDYRMTSSRVSHVNLVHVLIVFISFPLLLLAATHEAPSQPPAKLTQGCPADLLHSRSLRSVQVACRQQPATVVAAFEGVQDALAQCRERMRFQPWDCSEAGNIMHDPPLLKFGYRESALVWAMSSAGSAWGIATACAQGWIPDCSCSPPNADGLRSSQGSWEYGGCSFGVQHGITMSRKLLTKTTASKSPLRQIEKHNLKAGRLAVKKTIISSCKCHGVSGSCQQKTCWKRTATLDQISDYLVEKFARAQKYQPNATIKNADLVYLEPSPDHCLKKQTTPRVCAWRNETHSQGDCNKLCCGRGFSITHEVIHYKCDCKFVWCCNLVCKDCLQHRWVSTCN